MADIMKIVDGISVPLTQGDLDQIASDAAAQQAVLSSPTYYKVLRAAAYPPLQDVIAALANAALGDNTDITAINTLRAAVKIKYPKP